MGLGHHVNEMVWKSPGRIAHFLASLDTSRFGVRRKEVLVKEISV